MRFKAKLFKLGNSRSIYIPREVYTFLEVGEEYEFEVYTSGREKVYTPKQEKIKKLKNVITSMEQKPTEETAEEIAEPIEDYTLEKDDSAKRSAEFID